MSQLSYFKIWIVFQHFLQLREEEREAHIVAKKEFKARNWPAIKDCERTERLSSVSVKQGILDNKKKKKSKHQGHSAKENIITLEILKYYNSKRSQRSWNAA